VRKNGNAVEQAPDMIVYDLSCENNHRFEGWFASNEDFERQLNDALLACPLCGNGKIVRLPHASYVNTGVERSDRTPKSAGQLPQQYTNLGGEMLTSLIEHIIENTDDVGASFPEEARRIHYREIAERNIRGTASPREVKALKEEGIEVVALPIPPHRVGKTH
jgi:hypothetical protein